MATNDHQSPFDPDTEFLLEKSETPVDEDGYKLGEPKQLRCAECGASVLLTEEPSAGVDELGHAIDCPQRFARSDWWVSQLRGADLDMMAAASDHGVATDGGQEDR